MCLDRLQNQYIIQLGQSIDQINSEEINRSISKWLARNPKVNILISKASEILENKGITYFIQTVNTKILIVDSINLMEL